MVWLHRPTLPHSISLPHTEIKCNARQTLQVVRNRQRARSVISALSMPTARTSEDPALSSRKRKTDDFEWEASKENVMPLKRGRNVVDLNQALRAHDSVQTKLRLETEMKTREAAIAAYAGDDPLAHWLEYVRWLEVQMPEDTRKKFKVLEKCTRELKDDRKYRNDMRYVRLWIQYVRSVL
uniref:BUB1 N-terminal domain-containing protein n=1 Tax=Hyaloperonospora arabidopsidis (strain Emoy2) TaxID=559515 RepID=M4BR35_HYAAE